MKRTAVMLFVANCVLGIGGCGGSGDAAVAGTSAPPPLPSPPPPSPAPPPPSPVPPPPTTYSLTVTWTVPQLNTDGTTLTDISGYRIDYGSSPAGLTQSVPISGAGMTSHVVSGLAAGTYYFAVSTVNSAGIASAVSNAAARTVP